MKETRFPRYLIFVLLLCAAAAVYFSGLAHESIWYDEAYSALMSSHPYSQILRDIHNDSHPPVYYILLRTATLVWGNSPAGLRALSALGAVGVVSLGVGPVRRLFGDKRAIFYMLLTLFTPALLTYAHEARTYALSIWAVTATALFGYLAAKEGKTKDWVLFEFSAVMAAYLHYFGLVAMVFIQVFLLLHLLRTNPKRLKAFLIGGGAALLAYLPWLLTLLSQVKDVDEGFWLGLPGVFDIFRALLQPFAYKELYPTITPMMWGAVVLVVVLIVIGLVRAKKHGSEDQRTFSWLLVTTWLGTLISTVAASYLLAPFYYSRYMLPLTGLLVLMVSLGISTLGKGWLLWGAAALYAGLNIFCIIDIYTQYFNYPMEKLVTVLEEELQPGDVVVSTDSYSMGPLVYYLPQATHYYSQNTIEGQWGNVLDSYQTNELLINEEGSGLLEEKGAFWYVTANTGVSRQAAELLGHQPGWEETLPPRSFSEPYSYVVFTLHRYEFTGAPAPENVGQLQVHIAGIRPGGYLNITLYDAAHSDLAGQGYFHKMLNITSDQMDYTFYDLPFGAYMLVIFDDENKNYGLDMNADGSAPKEGVYLTNMESIVVGDGPIQIGFEDHSFSLYQPEMKIEAEIFYPDMVLQTVP